ncbi:hypothetical protein BDK51DRAFT_28600 [Blyttiomyces helicus]|uniref:Uncharacterized protein n=1 Tax=Blyttiomyces helicus TaxID=388810 RepID=A0A4P9WRM4_9FUNG|nr:hypothetical protein BDK51DRAFT_28600 [Blyttiomyces helicus]|eukprot:RKO94538.1 hypothetical protein BDK51DRAFT_28600 [Blyttiomyces helicus]
MPLCSRESARNRMQAAVTLLSPLVDSADVDPAVPRAISLLRGWLEATVGEGSDGRWVEGAGIAGGGDKQDERNGVDTAKPNEGHVGEGSGARKRAAVEDGLEDRGDVGGGKPCDDNPGRAQRPALLLTEVVLNVMRTTRRWPLLDKHETLRVCTLVCRTWHEPARTVLIEDMGCKTFRQVEELALARDSTGSSLPIRRLRLRASLPSPFSFVTRSAAPMLANLRSLEIAVSTGESVRIHLSTLATLLRSTPHIAALVLHAPLRLLATLDPGDRAIIAERIAQLRVLRVTPLRPGRDATRALVANLNEDIGPSISHWAVSGKEDLSQLHEGAGAELRFLIVTNAPDSRHADSPSLPPGYLAQIGALAPALRCVEFSDITTEDADVLALLAACPSLDHIDLFGQDHLTDAVPNALQTHPPLVALGLGSTSFSEPAVLALLRARGSALKRLDLRGADWASPRIVTALAAGAAPHLLAIFLTRSAMLPNSSEVLHSIKKGCPALQIADSPLSADSELPDGVRWAEEGEMMLIARDTDVVCQFV